MMKKSTKLSKQKGVTIVEFTIVASLFFILIFSIIEFGRLMFTWHVLNETTRRAARIASVCEVTAQDSIINTAIIGSVYLPNFTSTNLQLRYLDSDGKDVNTPLETPANFDEIRFVEASIDDYKINLIIPFDTFDAFGVDFTAPKFSTLLPRESLGVTRTVDSDCYG